LLFGSVETLIGKYDDDGGVDDDDRDICYDSSIHRSSSVFKYHVKKNDCINEPDIFTLPAVPVFD